MGAPPRGLPKLLHAGATVHVRSVHPDAVDEYQFRLRADDASELDCLTPDLPRDAFRGVFLPEALARGDALLAVTQTNGYGRKGDGKYHGADRPRGYTFRKTTPPFLLSEALAARARDRHPIALHFYDFLDDGQPLRLGFAEQVSRTIDVAGTPRSVTVARYQGDDQIIGAVLEVEPESKLVLLISRSDGEFAMNLVKIR